jgi:outer membrane protein OmpA-like peptidoglycan-associated protein
MRNRFRALITLFMAAGALHSPVLSYADSAQSYDPPWASDTIWAQNPIGLFLPYSRGWLEDGYSPWWQTRVANPISDYDPSKMAVGLYRLDVASDFELTTHQLLPGWTGQSSPSGINNVYTFTPGSSAQDKATTRMGQNFYTDLGIHPFSYLSGDIGAEYVGNYDQRYWFPISDEHRMFNDGTVAKITHADMKYDDGQFMIRGFEGEPLTTWVYQNDLFQLLPNRYDIAMSEWYRRNDGSLTPRGGETQIKSDFGTLDVLGGAEIRYGYGSSAFAKYDLPAWGTWENSVVFRDENVPFVLSNPDARRWAVSYNSSYSPYEQWQTHAGVMYQPFRLDEPYTDVTYAGSGNGTLGTAYQIDQRETRQSDAFGFLWQNEFEPLMIIDKIGLGYMYLAPTAGDKQQVSIDGTKRLNHDLTLSSAYMYRQPVVGPVPLLYQGTTDDPGALITSPRGPDDPFEVEWDNRKAHIFTATLVYNPAPATPFFKYDKNVIDDYNINDKNEAEWSGALQYRAIYYPTNTDRLYYWDEDRNLIYDPIFNNGALASSYPMSSGTGLLRWSMKDWSVTTDVSAGEAPAGLAIAYSSSTVFYKPTTIFINTGVTIRYKAAKAFFRYSQDVWGPEDYQVQEGWAYHQIYQAGLSYDFLKQFQAGFRYTGTRMNDDFIGSDIAAFNEYTFYLTWHFTMEHQAAPAFGKKLPPAVPEASLTVSAPAFTPDGSGNTRSVQFYPRAASETGILSWRVTVRNPQGEIAKQWDGTGHPPSYLIWNGLSAEGQPLPVAIYQATFKVTDLQGNEITTIPQAVEIQSNKAPAAPKIEALPQSNKNITVTQTPEGLKLTLSSLVLFDFGKYDLKPSAIKALEQVLEILKEYPENKLVISGHTDNVGGDAYNQKLSQLRAESVAHYLKTVGKIPPSRIVFVGYGKTKPAVSNVTVSGRQRNRRVEIDILKNK